MSEGLGKKSRKEIMKEILKELHKGLSPEEAKERFKKEVGNVTSDEIVQIEQELINEGITPEEIKSFCNVHALLFEENIKQELKETSQVHPVVLFKEENKEIKKITGEISNLLNEIEKRDFEEFKKLLLEKLRLIEGVNIHYKRKEELLFPYLEKKGFTGPSKVMWAKDDDIRRLIKESKEKLSGVKSKEEYEKNVLPIVKELVEEIEGMVFKEENILFPTSLEKLSKEEWLDILINSKEFGYVFISPPEEVFLLERVEARKPFDERKISARVEFSTGNLTLDEIEYIFDTIPVDITFIDKEDTVRYFSGGERIFPRTTSVIGRKVQNCHPPQSVHVVEKILKAFKEGRRNSVSFWINLKGKFVYIRYFAVRDRAGNYLGTLEVTQDITEIKTLEGEKRLLDEDF